MPGNALREIIIVLKIYKNDPPLKLLRRNFHRYLTSNMGISRDSRHKRRSTGGRKANLKKKRLYESGRPPAMTRLGPKRVHDLRVRGGNIKLRALRLDTGNFSWGSEGSCHINWRARAQFTGTTKKYF